MCSGSKKPRSKDCNQHWSVTESENATGASQSDGACEAQQTAGAPPCAFKFMVSNPPSLTLHGELLLRSNSEVNG